MGLATGIKEGKGGYPKAYINAGGRISIRDNTIYGRANFLAEVHTYHLALALIKYFDQVKSEKSMIQPSQEVKKQLYEAFEVAVEIDGGIRFSCWLGAIGGEGRFYADKTLISGSANGYLEDWKGDRISKGIWFELGIESKKFDWGFGMRSLLAGPYLGPLPDLNGEEGKLSLSNMENLGTYGPAGPVARVSGLSAGLNNFALGAHTGANYPELETGDIAVIHSDEKYNTIAVYKLVEDSWQWYETMSMGQGKWLEKQSLNKDEWIGDEDDWNEFMLNGDYSINYQIEEEGTYKFVAADENGGPGEEGTELSYTVTRFAPMPEFASETLGHDKDNKKVTWVLNDTAKNSNQDLFVGLSLIDATSGEIVANLTTTMTEGDGNTGGTVSSGVPAGSGTFIYELPGDLSTGSYYISGKLFTKRQVKVDISEEEENPEYVNVIEEKVLSLSRTGEFDFVNSNAPGKVDNVEVEALGNGGVKVTWKPVSGADGYRLTILTENGSPVVGLAPIIVEGQAKTSAEIQAGFISTLDDDWKIVDSIGIGYGRNYEVSVEAYKNREVDLKSADGSSEKYNIPVYGEAGKATLNIDEPAIPEIRVTSPDANKISDESGTVFYRNESGSVTFTLTADMALSSITAKLGESPLMVTGPDAAGGYSISPTFAADGQYVINITAIAGNGKDKAHSTIVVEVDTKAPILQVDGESATAYGGNISIKGYTENGAAVAYFGDSLQPDVQTDKGLFHISGKVTEEEGFIPVRIIATDRAGNMSEKSFDVAYEEAKKDDSNTYAVTVNSGYAQTTGTGRYRVNEIVTINAGTRSGYSFAGWTVDSGGIKLADASSATTTFTMLDHSVTVTARWAYNGGSGSSSSSPTHLTVPAAEGKVQVNYTVSGNTANLSLTNTKIAEIIAKSEEEAVIDLSKVKNINSVELSKEALLAFGRAGLGLTIKMPKGSLTLDVDAAASIASQATGSNLRMELKEVAQASLTAAQQQGVEDGSLIIDINIYSADKKIGSFEGSLTIEIPYTGSELVGVWYLNDEGELEKLESTFANGVVTFALDHLSLYVIGEDKAPVFTNPFTDVNAGDWFYDDVKFAYENGLMVGTGTTNFSPNQETTRGMMVTILHRLEGSTKVTGTNTFADVEEGKWYSNAIKWAAENSIVAGYGDGKFGPEDSITREQMAVILMNYAKLKGYDVSAKTDISKFTDGDKVSSWAKDALAWANAKGLIIGTGNEILAPQGLAVRAQVAAVLHRFIETFK